MSMPVRFLVAMSMSTPMPVVAFSRGVARRGQRHHLYSGAVIYQGGEPVWRHVGVARMHMRDVSDAYLDDYIARNWESIRHSVGGYKLEEEGVRLFVRVVGDYFTVLGLPLVELINWLVLRGDLQR